MKQTAHIEVGGVLVEYDEYVVDRQKSPEPGKDNLYRFEPGTMHYFLKGVEVLCITNAKALQRLCGGWTTEET